MNKFNYNFEWDPKKALSNLSKHSISFNEAATIFKDPKMVSIYDDSHSDYEERWVSIGLSGNGKLLVVSHTFRDVDKLNTVIRLFSTRKAMKQEIMEYEGDKK